MENIYYNKYLNIRTKIGNGFALLDKLGLKPDVNKSSSKTSVGSQRSKSANTRLAYRPRSIHGDIRLGTSTNDKSMDSFETYTSIYQISDRSCQTSLELIEPFVERAIKRRKLVSQETTLLFSDKEVNMDNETVVRDQIFDTNRDRKSSKMAEMLELDTDTGGGPPTGLGALGNLLLLPLIATHHNQLASQKKDLQNKKDFANESNNQQADLYV